MLLTFEQKILFGYRGARTKIFYFAELFLQTMEQFKLSLVSRWFWLFLPTDDFVAVSIIEINKLMWVNGIFEHHKCVMRFFLVW